MSHYQTYQTIPSWQITSLPLNNEALRLITLSSPKPPQPIPYISPVHIHLSLTVSAPQSALIPVISHTRLLRQLAMLDARQSLGGRSFSQSSNHSVRASHTSQTSHTGRAYFPPPTPAVTWTCLSAVCSPPVGWGGLRGTRY